MDAAMLRDDLREGKGGFLADRRAIAGLSLVAIGAMGLVSAYQLGILRRLPQPRRRWLDSNRVDGSAEAYKRFNVPDATLGVASYATTLVLAGMGGKQRARTTPWVPAALAAKVGFDVAQSIRMIVVQWIKFRSLCGWCLLSATASFLSAAFVASEARVAMNSVRAQARPKPLAK
jgi:uncharacterized membrane protein